MSVELREIPADTTCVGPDLHTIRKSNIGAEQTEDQHDHPDIDHIQHRVSSTIHRML